MEQNEILARIEELSSEIKRISEKQDSQFTELMLELKSAQSRETYHFDEEEEEDPAIYEEAKKEVIKMGKASTSFLQRKLGVGYARAARLIDMLEEEGVISEGSGAKPREVLIKPEDIE